MNDRSRTAGLRKKGFFRKGIVYLLLLIILVVTILPFVWMLSASLKNQATIFQHSMQLIPKDPIWSNYSDVWHKVPFATFYWNTIKVTFLSTAGSLISASLAAYAFAKLKFPGSNKLFLLYLATMMIPGQAIMIPQFTTMKHLHLVNSHWALILLHLFNPYGVFLLRQFFVQLPGDLNESARIDGCSELGIFARIILPLAKPALVTLGIFSLLWSWNDFLQPLIYLSKEKLYTIQMGIRYFQQLNGTDYPLIMAATTMSLIPIIIIYLFAQRYFIEGIAVTGTKG
ncbi:sugar ABC transporter ATP-binding protein [Paenibacillus yonginensis]|uniref:Sugar ABC transporter ATP-binding protein n=1 Tax=Paenibacillus yonginensis TaxID=1462996 RepID=A0A1B1N6W2_9BACL|nr:sugar ABC transporter ATP-binding protein [Paenibacillus yonginensis]